MDFKVAEAAGEGNVLLFADVLIAEENHLVGQESLPDFGDDLVSELFTETDAADLCADARRHGRYLESGECLCFCCGCHVDALRAAHS